MKVTDEGNNRPILDALHVSKWDIIAAQCYMVFSCIVALVCSAWTLDTYMDGSITMRAYSWVGTMSAATLLLGLIIEWVVYRRGGCCALCAKAESKIEEVRRKGVGVTVVHVATASICMFSVCAAAVNIYENASTGLYALSCAVIAFYWVYHVMYTPSTVMHVAVHSNLPEAEQLIIGLQLNATRLVWRSGRVNPMDYL